MINRLLLQTARYAQGAEYAEVVIFSFAAERAAKENRPAASLQKLYYLPPEISEDKLLPAAGPDIFSFSASQRKAKR